MQPAHWTTAIEPGSWDTWGDNFDDSTHEVQVDGPSVVATDEGWKALALTLLQSEQQPVSEFLLAALNKVEEVHSELESVSPYRWSSGVGFFPDFVVCIEGRSEGDGVALLEVKGRNCSSTTGQRLPRNISPTDGRSWSERPGVTEGSVFGVSSTTNWSMMARLSRIG